MKSILFTIAVGLASLFTPVFAQDIRNEQVQFAHGSSGITIKDTIVGYQSVNYMLNARAGQSMTVTLNTDNASNYFNIFTKASGDEALFIGSINGNSYQDKLPADGIYTVQVFLMRNAARRNEKANYTLDISID